MILQLVCGVGIAIVFLLMFMGRADASTSYIVDSYMLEGKQRVETHEAIPESLEHPSVIIIGNVCYEVRKTL